MESVNAEKSRLRKAILAMRRKLDRESVAAQSALIAKHLTACPQYAAAGVIMAFAAMPDEPQTDLIMQDVLRQDKKLCIPRVGETYGNMEAVEVSQPAGLVEGKFGILTPPPQNAVVDPSGIQLIIVPGVAFTLTGQRLGMGAGFYDRFLERAKQAVLIGLALDCQITAHIPCEDHDYLVDHLATKAGIINCQTGKM